MRELEHSRPADIEAESFRIIGAELAERGIVLPADQAPLVKRAIHTTADFDYARNLVFTPGAVEAGVRALRAGTPILTDTNMARSGINRGALERLGISVHCFMADPEVARRAGVSVFLAPYEDIRDCAGALGLLPRSMQKRGPRAVDAVPAGE